MPLDLQDYKKAQMKRLPTITVPGGTLNIGYYPDQLTPSGVRAMLETVKKVSSFADKPPTEPKEAEAKQPLTKEQSLDQWTAISDGNELVVRQFLDTVAEWDMTDNGEPVPITREGLDGINYDLLNLILEKIQENENADLPKTEKPSEPTS